MLERASRCLESGVRCSLTTQTHSRHGLRLLHSSFWEHGGSRFDVPPFAIDTEAASLAHLPDGDASQTHAAAAANDGPILDFLYPPQALALLARPLPRAVESTVQKRRIQGCRKFSSSPRVERKEDVRLSRLRPSPSQSPLDVFAGTSKTTPRLLQHTNSAQISTQASNDSRAGEGDNDSGGSSGRLEDVLGRYNAESATLPRKGFTQKSSRSMQLDDDEVSASLPPPRLIRTRLEAPVRVREVLPLTGNAIEDAGVHRERLLEHIGRNRKRLAMNIIDDAVSRNLRHDFGAGRLLDHLLSQELWPDAGALLWKINQYAEKMSDPEILDRVLLDLRQAAHLQTYIHSILSALSQSKLKMSSGLHFLLLHLARIRVRNILNATSNTGVNAYAGSIIGLVKAVRLQTSDPGMILEGMMTELLQARKVFDRRLYTKLLATMWESYSSQVVFRPTKTLLINLLNAWKDRKIVTPLSSEGGLHSLTPESVEKIWQTTYGPLSYIPRLCLMIVYANEGQAKKVEVLADEYVRRTKPNKIDPNFFWPLVQVHAVRRDAPAAQQAFKKIIEDFNVKPTARTWDLLLRAYERSDDLQGALDCFQERLDSEIELTPQSLTQIMTLYSQVGNADAITDLLRLAEQSSVTIDTRMVSTLIVAHSRAGNNAAAEQVLAQTVEQQKTGRVPGTLTFCYNSIILMHAMRRDVDAATNAYQSMKSSNVPVDESTFSALILAFTRRRRPDDAWVIIDKTMPDHGCVPGDKHYTATMIGYLHVQNYKQALRVWHRMHAQGVRPSIAARATYHKARNLDSLSALKRTGTDVQPTSAAPIQEIIDELVNAMNKDASFSRKHDLELHRTTTQDTISTMFETLVNLHGPQPCFRAAQELFETSKIEQASRDGKSLFMAPPFKLTVALMSIFGRTNNVEHVDKCWELVLKQSEGILTVPVPAIGIRDALDVLQETEPIAAPMKKRRPKWGKPKPDPVTPKEQPRAGNAEGLRMELSLPFRIWALSVLTVPDATAAAVTRVVGAITDLYRSGFQLDNATINAVVVRLCEIKPARTLLAFLMVERFLMTNDFQWRRPLKVLPLLDVSSDRQARRVFLDTRYIVWPKRVVAPNDRLPLYPTMVHLAYALVRLRHRHAKSPSALAELAAEAEVDASRGLSESAERHGQVGTTRLLRKYTRLTLNAVRKLPITFDALQVRLLHGGKDEFVVGRRGRYAWQSIGLGGAVIVNRDPISEKKLMKIARRRALEAKRRERVKQDKEHARYWANALKVMSKSNMVSLKLKGFKPVRNRTFPRDPSHRANAFKIRSKTKTLSSNLEDPKPAGN